jgi:hypothetical protein
MYRWLVFLHILGAFAFFMAHGASAMMAVRLRKERDLQRIQAILDLSQAALPFMYVSLLVLLGAGIAAGVQGHWFAQGWIWAALVILVVLAGWMMYYAGRYYTPVRKAVGLPYREGRDDMPAEPPLGEAEIQSAVAATNPMLLMSVSFGLIGVILYLMVFKPF